MTERVDMNDDKNSFQHSVCFITGILFCEVSFVEETALAPNCLNSIESCQRIGGLVL